MRGSRLMSCGLALVLLAGGARAPAQTLQGTAFTYQGRLTDAGSVANGQFDFRFRLFNAAVAGVEVAPFEGRENVPVTNGLFTLNGPVASVTEALDFGSVFTGDRRWLQIEVRPGASGGAFTVLTPRQELTGTPYATGLRLPYAADVDPPAFANLLSITNSGTGAGAGRAGFFANTDPANNNAALRVETSGICCGLHSVANGNAWAGWFESNLATATESTLLVQQAGLGRAGEFAVQNAANAAAALFATTSGSGPAVHAEGFFQTGSPTRDGRIQLFRNGSALRIFETIATSQGVDVNLYDEIGNRHTVLQRDVNGTGGFFAVQRSATAPGFTVDGNDGGTNEPTVLITGSVRSATFDMGNAGNTSVVLPTDAIAAPEILDEPGVASNIIDSFTLAGPLQTIMSRSIDCPTAGFVLAIASAQVNANHVTGTNTNITVGVSDAAAALPVNQDVAFFVPSGAPTGLYTNVGAVHGLFQVAAGVRTFFYLGEEVSGVGSINDAQLSLLFVPSAYGTVTPTFLNLTGEPDRTAPERGPMTPAEYAAERAQSVGANRARIERELADMKAQLDRLQSELNATLQNQETPAPAPAPGTVVSASKEDDDANR